ncbi:hypothetical protein KY284_032385 [Solanum tuberosum]|nr:hypothetical protein KY284_032385 [Solanum tuberosum]
MEDTTQLLPILAVHFHNDLGLATANTLAIVMAIKCRGEEVLGGVYTGINTEHIFTTSNMICDGILKNKGTHEFISAEDVGFIRASEHGIRLGKLRYTLFYYQSSFFMLL